MTTHDELMLSLDGNLYEHMYYGEEYHSLNDYRRLNNNYTVMQYIGLLDKNGKEIFEGDIVKQESAYGDTNLFVVKWSDKLCGFVPFTCGTCVARRYGTGINSQSVEIIGNVFENPNIAIQCFKLKL